MGIKLEFSSAINKYTPPESLLCSSTVSRNPTWSSLCYQHQVIELHIPLKIKGGNEKKFSFCEFFFIHNLYLHFKITFFKEWCFLYYWINIFLYIFCTEQRGSGDHGRENLTPYEYVGRAGYVFPTASLAGTEVSVDEIRSAASIPQSETYPPSLHAALVSPPPQPQTYGNRLQQSFVFF